MNKELLTMNLVEVIIKNQKKPLFVTFVILMGLMSSCSTIRAIFGIPEPPESEASIRKKITAAVDKASSEIIKGLPGGVRLAVLSGTSLLGDQEIVVANLKSQGYSDSQVYCLC